LSTQVVAFASDRGGHGLTRYGSTYTYTSY
jgi:hypothetical protein